MICFTAYICVLFLDFPFVIFKFIGLLYVSFSQTLRTIEEPDQPESTTRNEQPACEKLFFLT